MSIKPTQTALTGAVLSALVAIIPPQSANAAACTPNGDGNYVVSNNCDAIPDTTTPVTPTSTADFKHIQVNQLQNNALTIGNLDVTHQSTQATNILNVASRNHTGGTITIGNINANLGNQQISSVIYAQGGVNVTAKDINATLTSNAVLVRSGFSANNYAILAHGAGAPVGSVSQVTIENMNLTKHSQDGVFGFLAVTNAALRAIQASDNSGTPTGGAGKIVVKQNLNATLSGDLIQGIHASGSSTNATTGVEAVSTIELNNANLRVINNVTSPLHTPYSAAIMVGKPIRNNTRDAGAGKGLITVSGTLNIDASELHKDADAIRLFHDDSKLEATGETNVLASRSAIAISPVYDTVSDGRHPASNISVSLNNATLNTNGTDASLIKIYNNQTNTNVSISGKNSLLLAPEKGWLLEVGNDASDAGNATTFTLAGGQHFGLVHKHADNHQLNVDLDGKTTWYLKPKDTERTSTFTTLNIGADAALDATNALAPNMDKTVTMHNGHSMTLSGSVGESELGADQTFTLKGNVTNAGTINLFDPIEELTADLPKHTNTLIIDGNYEGKDGSTIYMNTGWTHESGSGNGNSKSDLLRIKGKATGTTKVIPQTYNDEGEKQNNIITGNAEKTGSERNSVPVIIVEQHDGGSHFSGTAKIKNSPAETQLTSRDNGSGGREYYWTLEATTASPSPTPGTPGT
ncbi:MAG: hypothetical protein Q4B71_07420, partial [Cardiobacteriaceae bacterium]|nr:hypothetical protein [Cardiobacteriaceae bacterium]